MKSIFPVHSGAVAGAAFAIALCSGPSVLAGEVLVLRQIMRDLGQDAQAITDGLSREDYALVARAARRIADHPRPPLAERGRLMAFMGADMLKFKGLDADTHEAAGAVAGAAGEGDGQAVIDAFQRLQSTCLACHQAFRKPLVAHFYGAAE